MNSMRNLFIVGVALFLGLSIPEYFREYTAKALHGPAHSKAGWVSYLLYMFPFNAKLLALTTCYILCATCYIKFLAPRKAYKKQLV